MSENGCLKDGMFHNLQVTGHLFQNNAITPSIRIPGTGEVHSQGAVAESVSGQIDTDHGTHSGTDLHDKTEQELVRGLNYYNFENAEARHIPLFVYNQAQAQNASDVLVDVSNGGIDLPSFPTSYVLYDKLYIQEEQTDISKSEQVYWNNFYLQANKSYTFKISFQFAIPQITNLDTLTFGLRRVTGYNKGEASKLPEGSSYRYTDFPGNNVSEYKDYYGIQISNNPDNLYADLAIYWNDDDTRSEGVSYKSIGLPNNHELFSTNNSTWRFDLEFSTTGQSGNILEVKNINLTNMRTYTLSNILPGNLPENANNSIVLNNADLDLSHVYFSPFIWYKPKPDATNTGSYEDPFTNVSLSINKALNTANGLSSFFSPLI